jgi:1L-myo-inositol 1-phosphate cytidylyltransferase
MRALGRGGKLRAFDIGDASWQDVDTPEALAYTESIFDSQFCQPAAQEAVFHV